MTIVFCFPRICNFMKSRVLFSTVTQKIYITIHTMWGVTFLIFYSHITRNQILEYPGLCIWTPNIHAMKFASSRIPLKCWGSLCFNYFITTDLLVMNCMKIRIILDSCHKRYKTRFRSEVLSLESLWIWFGRLMVLNITETSANYSLLCLKTIKS